MKPKPARPANLRQSAEAQLRERTAEGGASPPRDDVETRRLLHELQVHQVELEIQNEELRGARGELEAALEKFTALFDFAPIGYFTLGRDGSIRTANFAAAALLGLSREALAGRRFESFVAAPARAAFAQFLQRLWVSPDRGLWLAPLVGPGALVRYLQVEAVATGGTDECLLAAMEVTASKLVEAELIRSIDQLQEAGNREATLTGLLTICAACKKIRDGDGHWEPIEGYVQSRSHARFSHGLCPVCVTRIYPDK